jgi:hypothetical protein
MSDPIAEAAAALATHPNADVRLLAERLAAPKVRTALGAAGDHAERLAERDQLLRQLGAAIAGQSTARRAELIATQLARYRASAAWRHLVARIGPIGVGSRAA